MTDKVTGNDNRLYVVTYAWGGGISCSRYYDDYSCIGTPDAVVASFWIYIRRHKGIADSIQRQPILYGVPRRFVGGTEWWDVANKHLVKHLDIPAEFIKEANREHS